MPNELAEHVADVLARLDRLVSPADKDYRALVLAVHAHDQTEAIREQILSSSSEAAHAQLARRVIYAFGQIWKCATPHDVASYVSRHGDDLGAILAFELAHEGEATTQMMAAARRGGLTNNFDALVGRLQCGPLQRDSPGRSRWRRPI